MKKEPYEENVKALITYLNRVMKKEKDMTKTVNVVR